ncbi:eIF3-p47 with JAB/PAD domain [Cryptosporidium ryanae]|uniref:eIF3-p47 with JAB/PAD domain n=1 Tax=Cryptosporidium ryanae TaxID=515981 RepID=UPI00351A6C80|nr:eIF3-p47 with JAB/PAD domain [Cryptosporidium ryanae]
MFSIYSKQDIPFESDGYLVSHLSDKSPTFDSLSRPSIPSCRVNPLVILSILDSHLRRQSGHQHVIGTLLGYVNEGGNIIVSDSFVDRHLYTEDGMLSIMIDTHETMFGLKQKISPKLQVVGWYSTNPEINSISCAVNNWFKGDTSSSKFQQSPLLLEPIHITVDPSFSTGKLSINGYVQVQSSIASSIVAIFRPVPLEIASSLYERLHISRIVRPLMEKHHLNAVGIPPKHFPRTILGPEDEVCTVLPLNNISSGSQTSEVLQLISKLLLMFQRCQSYIQRVKSGELPKNSMIGRQIDYAIHSICDVDANVYDIIKNNSTQDALIIGCLTELTKVQISLSEKLQSLIIA